MPTVVAQPYSTAGNGGRKLVRLSNGWLVGGVTKGNNGFDIYVSKDNGNSWSILCYANQNASGSLAMVSNGTNVYILTAMASNDRLYRYSFDATTVKNVALIPGDLDAGNTLSGAVSLAIDPTNGHLHAAWASRNAAYPSSWNIRYAKSTDGGVTWSTAEQVTAYNNATLYQFQNPSIVVSNGIPIILYQALDNSAYRIYAKTRATGNWDSGRDGKTVYSGGANSQSAPSAVVDKDGVIHVAWEYNTDKYIGYAKSIDGGITWISIAAMGNGYINRSPSISVDNKNNIIIMYGKYLSSPTSKWHVGVLKNFSPVSDIEVFGSTNTMPSVLYDATFTGEFGTTPPTIYQSPTSVQYIGSYTTNQTPTVTLNTTDNQTLYENDIFAISGTATDADNGNVLSVKYSIDGGTARAILANVSTGTPMSYAKNLTYKAGALYDGATVITSTLAEGSQHTLKVWAEDDKGGKSNEITRSFYVVPNRAATLTLDAFVTRTGLINTDVVNVSGKVADLDRGNVKVRYKIGNGAFVQVYDGPATEIPKDFNFNILLSDLAEGQNAITVQAVDAYNAVTKVILNLTKNKVETPLLNAFTYYEIIPPNGTTDGLQLYIERELGDLDVSVDVFMGANGTTEIFVPMTLSSTANLTNGNVEDTFSYEHGSDASKVVVRINMARTSAATNKAIKKISGVLT